MKLMAFALVAAAALLALLVIHVLVPTLAPAALDAKAKGA